MKVPTAAGTVAAAAAVAPPAAAHAATSDDAWHNHASHMCTYGDAIHTYEYDGDGDDDNVEEEEEVDAAIRASLGRYVDGQLAILIPSCSTSHPSQLDLPTHLLPSLSDCTTGRGTVTRYTEDEWATYGGGGAFPSYGKARG